MRVKVKEYAYYPGCSLKESARQYEESLLRSFAELGLELVELEDWNCCGSTLCRVTGGLDPLALTARDLALAGRDHEGRDPVVPCSACLLSFIKAEERLERDPEARRRVGEALRVAGLDLEVGLKVRVRHPLEVLDDLGLEEIGRRVKRPLQDLKVAPYYGCLLVRPYNRLDHPLYPEAMDRLLLHLGAEVVDYPLKTGCCGGAITGMAVAVAEEPGLSLNYALLKEAQERGADAIVTLCPLCQFNLDCYQGRISEKYRLESTIPVIYFTQVLGLALGIPEEELGFGREMVSVKGLLAVLRLRCGWVQPANLD